jgi:hypothetical protein
MDMMGSDVGLVVNNSGVSEVPVVLFKPVAPPNGLPHPYKAPLEVNTNVCTAPDFTLTINTEESNGAGNCVGLVISAPSPVHDLAESLLPAAYAFPSLVMTMVCEKPNEAVTAVTPPVTTEV